MAESRQLSDFGVVSLLISHQPTLRDAIVATIQYRHLINDSLAMQIDEEDTIAILREEVVSPIPARQATELAIGVLHTLSLRGLAPGRDVAVVGFDDSQVAQTYLGGLTSVRQPLEDVAVEIVRGLQGLLTEPATARPGVLLAPSLEVRGSS